MRRTVVAVLTVAVLFLRPATAQPQSAVDGSAAALRAHEDVNFLCSPELRGRGAADPGYETAARFVAAELTRAGYGPLIPGGGLIRPFTSTVRNWTKFTGGYAAIPQPLSSGNVIGYLPGYTDEVVIIGAHLDHLGYQQDESGNYAPGADDNASGVAAVLTIARALADGTQARAHRRGIVIAFWGAEEPGLLGSEAFVKELKDGRGPFGLKDIALVLNLDMVGRRFPEDDPSPGGAKTVMVIGANRVTTLPQYMEKNPALAAILAQAAARDPRLGMTFNDKGQSYFSRTDSYSFVQARPDVSTMFFTGPEHEDYHAVTDTPEKLDYDRLVRIAALAYRIALQAWDSGDPLICNDCR